MNQGTFTLTFGQEPSSYIKRDDVAKEICDDFFLDFPLSHVYVITGVRGSGKTVLLTSISKKIAEKKDWIVVDVNPNREILSLFSCGEFFNLVQGIRLFHRRKRTGFEHQNRARAHASRVKRA